MHRDNVRIAEPCHADWETMSGDEKKRFCQLCDKHVHDLSAVTEREARRIVKTGRCVQYRTDAEGNLLFKTGRRAALVAGVLAALSTPALAAGAAANADTDGKSLAERFFEWWSGASNEVRTEPVQHDTIPEIDTVSEQIEVVIPEAIPKPPVVPPGPPPMVKGRMVWHPPTPPTPTPAVDPVK